MDIREFYVSLSTKETAKLIDTAIVQGSISGKVIDSYRRKVDEKELVVYIFEKYYMRTSNRASLTVVIDNLEGKTKVHATASGGGEGATFRFDWGAGGSFVNSVEKALEDYKV